MEKDTYSQIGEMVTNLRRRYDAWRIATMQLDALDHNLVPLRITVEFLGQHECPNDRARKDIEHAKQALQEIDLIRQSVVSWAQKYTTKPVTTVGAGR